MKLSLPKRLAVHAILLAGSALFLFPFVWLVVTSLKPIEQTMKMPPEWLPKAYFTRLPGRGLPAATAWQAAAEGEDAPAPPRWLLAVAARLALPQRVQVKRERQFLPARVVVRLEEGERAGKMVTLPAPRFEDGVAVLDAPEEGDEGAEARPVRVRARLVRELYEPRVVVRVREGKRAGERVLLPAEAFRDGRAQIEVRVVDRTELRWVRAHLEQRVPKGHWLVQEKVARLAQEAGPPLRWDCVPAEAITERVQPAWSNYRLAIRYTGYYPLAVLGWTVDVPYFVLYLINTLIVAVLGMIGVVFSSALAAYSFARVPWRGRDTCFFLTLCTMMVPFAVTMVPLYGVFRALGWIGTLKPLWVPAWFGHAFNIFLLRQFFRTIPQDLTDAAKIDGCTEFGIFWRIILPLSRPALAVVALFHFMYAWKDFMGPLIFLTEQHTFTLSLGLQHYQSQHGGSEWHYLMAASTMMILPIIVLFFFTQRTFIQGISTTGMKG